MLSFVETARLQLTGSLEPRGGWVAAQCPIAKTMDLVGNRTAFLILREAFYGTTRFDDFAERVGVSEPAAAARLRELVEAELLVREPYREHGQRTRMQYRLTDKGSQLFPALAAMMQWGDRWLGPARVELRHRDCGCAVHAELRCTEGHAVEVDDIDLVARDDQALLRAVDPAPKARSRRRS
jgi:DNA-binding HxlR family transcriptional regulator